MSKYLQIQIPNACHEDWDKMTPAKQGKFCNSCQKTVVDFSLMSDGDLVNFFLKNTGNVCGKFYSDQLNTDIPIPGRRIPWLKYFFQITLPAFLFSLKSNAQTNTLKGKVACVERPITRTVGEVMAIPTREIKGKVVDDDGNPIANASVILKGGNAGTVADSAGNFSLMTTSSTATIVASSIGFDVREFTYTDTSNCSNLSLKLTRQFAATLGMVAVTTKKKKTFSIPFLSSTSLCSPASFTVFPNPVPSNSMLGIKWNNDITSPQDIEIYNAMGNLLQKERLTINKKVTRQSIDLKQLPAGSYVIKITDSKTHKVSSQQFIVE